MHKQVQKQYSVPQAGKPKVSSPFICLQYFCGTTLISFLTPFFLFFSSHHPASACSLMVLTTSVRALKILKIYNKFHN